MSGEHFVLQFFGRVAFCPGAFCPGGILSRGIMSWIPAMDMLYNTTNGQAHNNSTTCCITNKNSLPTDKNLPHPNILTCRDVGLWHCDVANLLYNKLENCYELVRCWCCTTCP